MKRYLVRESIPREFDTKLAALDPMIRHLLYYRGVQTQTDAEEFLSPDYDFHTHDPFLLQDMERSVERILASVKKNERICIYSDYDADGIPGGVILHDFFKKIGYSNFHNYIPHRHDEGFGLHKEAVETIAKEGTKLLITVDCGITDVAEVEHANSFGMDVIITDHHLPGPILPPAYAVVNPKREGNKYPYDMLCGSGVAFKLVQALVMRGDFSFAPGWEKWLLDMVGMATCADMVPLTGENRTFAYYGLKVLRKSPRMGLMNLLRKLNVRQRDLTEDDIGFTIVPRINAASRMGVPKDAFRLLSTSDEVEADELSTHLNKINDERKGVVAAMVKEMRKTLAERFAGETMRKVIVLGNPLWRPALLGLAANALMEAHNRPVFLWGREGGETIKGSCRSDGSVSVVDLMRQSPEIFSDFGGHKQAGGFTVVQDKVHFLEEGLVNAYEKICLEQNGGEEEVFVDRKLNLDQVNWDTHRLIDQLAPFGTGNPKPLFLFEAVEVKNIKQFGKEMNHLNLEFEKSDGKKVTAISFFTKPEDFQEVPEKGGKINLVASLEKSVFRNFPELRLRIVDIF